MPEEVGALLDARQELLPGVQIASANVRHSAVSAKSTRAARSEGPPWTMLIAPSCLSLVPVMWGKQPG